MIEIPPVLAIDPEAASLRIERFLRHEISERMHRRGAVVGVSGGIDSAVTLALCVRAFGPERVLGLRLPERESSASSLEFAGNLCHRYGVEVLTEDITPVLDALGVYVKREAVVHRLFPGFGKGWSYRLRLPDELLDGKRIGFYRIEVRPPEGHIESLPLSYTDFLTLTAATNMKQRVRMTVLYHAAESRRYAVAGTTNLTESAAGFYVRYGDGGVDVEPIAQLYKTQVFMLAEYLGVPEEIRSRTPSPDTYSFPVSDAEFYFGASYPEVDTVLSGMSRGSTDEEIAGEAGLPLSRVGRLREELEKRETATVHLREFPPSCPPDWDVKALTA